MKSTDESDELEHRQQQFVESVLQTLYAEARRSGEYRAAFHNLALSALAALQYPDLRKAGVQSELERLVWKPIEQFTADPIERRYLLLLVFEKVFESVRAAIASEYHAAPYAQGTGLEHSKKPHRIGGPGFPQS